MTNTQTSALTPPGKAIGRRVHIDFLRIIAILLVLFNHSGQDGFFLFAITENPILQWIYAFLSIACKVAVPIFFMISGALLLGKEESIADVYKKRVLKFAVILLVASLGNGAYKIFRYGETISLERFWQILYSDNMITALWYLYSHLALLTMLPLLRRMVKALRDKEYLYLAVMFMIVGGIRPIFEYLALRNEYTINWHLKGALFTATNIVYSLMGYYFERVMAQKHLTKKNACLGVLFSALSISLLVFLTLHRGRAMGVLSESQSQFFHDSNLIAIPAFTVYFSAKLFFEKVRIPKKVGKFISAVGGTVFGVFLLEAVLRQETWFVFKLLRPYIKTMPACFVYLLCCFAMGSLGVYLLKKIPGVKKFL